MSADEGMTETRARRKIREAAERHGLTISSMDYQPVGQMIEMQGRDGGWTVFVKDYGVAMGFSWKDVVEEIDGLAPGWKDGTIHG